MERDNGVFSRRGFLAAGAAAAGMSAMAIGAEEKKKPAKVKKAAPAAAKAKARKKAPIGLQLYSVRSECEKDVAGTLKAVGKMGYDGVEFAGYYDQTAKQLRKLLDDNGLVCCGTHAQFDTLLGDNLKETIEFNKVLGNKYLIVPWLPEEYRASKKAWLDTCKVFNELSEKVKPHGMRVGYHNHDMEYKDLDGEIPWDIFSANTNKDVILQLDTCNCMHGGADPLPYIYRYPGRNTTIHVKDYSKTNDKALLGEGDINWKAFFALCKAVGNVEWYIIEQESYAYPPLECVDKCLKNLKKMKLV